MMVLPAAVPTAAKAASGRTDNGVMPGADGRSAEGGFAGVAERLRNTLNSSPSTSESDEAELDRLAAAGLESDTELDTLNEDTNSGTLDSLTDVETSEDGLNSVLAGDAEADSEADASLAAAPATVTHTLPKGESAPASIPQPAAEMQADVAPVQMWRLHEQARASSEAAPVRLPNSTAAEPARLERGNLTLDGVNTLLMQRLNGVEASRQAPAAAAARLEVVSGVSESVPSFGTALTAARAGATHEWAPLTVQPGDKAVLGEQLLQALKDKVELQLNQRVQQARIKLDPPEMGRMELTVRLEGDRLHVQINASHGALRDAITAQADRLRQDLLAHHGGGVEVNVGQQDRQQDTPAFHDDIQIGAASADLGDDTSTGSMGHGWVNALA